MFYYNFRNSEEFDSIFGVRVCNNGNKVRQNKILLSLYKSRPLLHYHRLHGEGLVDSLQYPYNRFDWLQLINTTQLYTTAKRVLQNLYTYDNEKDVFVLGLHFHSNKYETDEYNGLCMDGDSGCIRYRNTETDRVYKMKAGKFFRHLIDSNEITNILPETVKIHLCESFVEEWRVYAQQNCNTDQYELHFDYSFDRIYNDSGECKGYFGSCMSGEGQYDFYNDAVTAHAAYLTDSEDNIVARCVVFDEVRDDTTGEIYRLAERQYSSEQDNILKRILIDKLIQGGYIDGYKRVGVGCHDNNAYVSNSGESWEDKCFSIECCLDSGDHLSYQDSFVFYNRDSHRAYNYCESDYTDRLDTTDAYFNDDSRIYCDGRNEYYDEDLTRWCENTQTNEYEDDCVYISGEGYYYCGYDCECCEDYGVIYCAYHNDYELKKYATYFEEGDCWVCDDYYSEYADDWYERNDYVYCEYDDSYLKINDDCKQVTNVYYNIHTNVSTVNGLPYGYRERVYYTSTEYMSYESIDILLSKGEAVEIDGVVYYGELFTDDYNNLLPMNPEILSIYA